MFKGLGEKGRLVKTLNEGVSKDMVHSGVAENMAASRVDRKVKLTKPTQIAGIRL